MTPKKKLYYLLGLIAVFVVLIPILILYSMGYRLNSEFRLVKTGGIYLVNNELDAAVLVNGKKTKTSSLFERDLFIRNLIPKVYYVRIEKEGYRPWKKNVNVHEQKVEVCYPLLIPYKLKPGFIPKYLKKTADQKKWELNEEYSDALKVFKTYDNPVRSIIPGWEDSDIKKYKLNANRRLNKKVFLFLERNKIYVKWTGTNDKRPFFIDTQKQKLVYAPEKKIISFGFFPGRNDSMIVLLEDLNLYAIEIDTRFEIQNIYKIMSECRRFAVLGEFLFFYAGNAIYRIDFEP